MVWEVCLVSKVQKFTDMVLEEMLALAEKDESNTC